MLKKSRRIIILLIFYGITYTIILVMSSSFYANSYMIGILVATIDIILLQWFLTSAITDDSNKRPIVFLLATIRWVIFSVILAIGFIFYNANPIAIIVGITLPFIIYIIYHIKKYIMEYKNGASF